MLQKKLACRDKHGFDTLECCIFGTMNCMLVGDTLFSACSLEVRCYPHSQQSNAQRATHNVCLQFVKLKLVRKFSIGLIF